MKIELCLDGKLTTLGKEVNRIMMICLQSKANRRIMTIITSEWFS